MSSSRSNSRATNQASPMGELFSERSPPSGRKEEEEERAEPDKERTRQADASIAITPTRPSSSAHEAGRRVHLARYWGSDKERAERWTERTMRAESLKVVYPVVDDGLDYAPNLKDLPLHERVFGRPPIALPDKEHQHQHLDQRPAPRCWERCHWRYLTSERCPNRCIHARGHRLSHDCSRHCRRPKQPPPPRPPQVRSSGSETEVGLQAAYNQ